jgi:hypothetical protein
VLKSTFVFAAEAEYDGLNLKVPLLLIKLRGATAVPEHPSFSFIVLLSCWIKRHPPARVLNERKEAKSEQ